MSPVGSDLEILKIDAPKDDPAIDRRRLKFDRDSTARVKTDSTDPDGSTDCGLHTRFRPPSRHRTRGVKVDNPTTRNGFRFPCRLELIDFPQRPLQYPFQTRGAPLAAGPATPGGRIEETAGLTRISTVARPRAGLRNPTIRREGQQESMGVQRGASRPPFGPIFEPGPRAWRPWPESGRSAWVWEKGYSGVALTTHCGSIPAYFFFFFFTWGSRKRLGEIAPFRESFSRWRCRERLPSTNVSKRKGA